MADRYASLKQGLVGCWIPSISGSGLLLPDLSGRGNNGVLTNMDASDWVSASYGRALDFDGVNDLVSISTTGQSQFCVSLWFRIRAFKSLSTDGVVLAITNGANDNLYIAQRASGSNTLTCNAFDGTVRGIYGTGPALSVNVWTHAVCTAANGLYQIYINGSKTTETAGAVVSSTANTITIGNYTDGLRPGDQLIDDVRLYNRALTEPEIRLLASEPGIGFKRNSSAFATRYAYKPDKPRNYGVVRVKETDYATLRQGLVGAWCPSLPNGGGGNTLPDVSGYGNHGVLTNMSPDDWVSGQYGRALDFDGSNDKVELGARDLLRQPLSISAWAYRRSSNANHTIIDGATDSSNSFGAHLRFTTANKIRWYFNNANLSLVDTTTTPSLNTWHHVTGTFDGVTSRIYLNGTLEASATGDAFGTAAGNYRIGCLSTVYGTDVGVMDGLIDDVRLYSRALTESEIRLLASRPGIGLRQDRDRNTFYQFPSFQSALARRSSAIIGGGIT